MAGALRQAAAPPPGLHHADRVWPLSSCYADLWIRLLESRGLEPRAMLGFAAALEWEGDQFTFLKPDSGDLASLYGLRIQELAIWNDLERHVAAQVAQGRPVLVELDAHHLPDLVGSSYRQEHGKTTVAILGLDVSARRCDYIHNASRDVLEGEDYDALLRPARIGGLPLPPYAEMVKRDPGATQGPLEETACRLLARHAARRGGRSQVAAFRAAFTAQLAALLERPAEFHPWAFNTLRQFGAGAELLADGLDWLEAQVPAGLGAAAAPARGVAAGAKALQFRVARLVARGRMDPCDEIFDALATDEAALSARLDRFLA